MPTPNKAINGTSKYHIVSPFRSRSSLSCSCLVRRLSGLRAVGRFGRPDMAPERADGPFDQVVGPENDVAQVVLFVGNCALGVQHGQAAGKNVDADSAHENCDQYIVVKFHDSVQSVGVREHTHLYSVWSIIQYI